MDLKEAKQVAKGLIKKHCSDYKFKFAGYKQKFGTCSYKTKIIKLSRHLTELNNKETVTNVILHEIAHALTPHQHHNNTWKNVAQEIGCDAKRCYDVKEVTQPEGVGKLACPECKTEVIMYRRRKKRTGVKSCCMQCYRNYKKYVELEVKQ